MNTEQKGGRIARGMSRWVKKGSVSIKLGLEKVPDSANEVRGTKPVVLI